MLPTPGDMSGLGLNLHSSTNVNYPSFQPTLGQMADQFQERARVERKEKNTRKRELGDVEDRPVKPPGYTEYENVEGNNYDDGSDGEGDGGGDNYGYDDGEGDGEGDGDGDGGDDEPGTVPSGHESTGRWTRPEHELFLQALKKYGKEWKKVAGMVKTRTVVQTRTHAQKYFQKLTKSSSGSGGGGSSGGNYGQSRGENSSSNGGSSGQKGAAPFYHKQGKGGRGGKIEGSTFSPPGSHMHNLGLTDASMGMNPMLLASMGNMNSMNGMSGLVGLGGMGGMTDIGSGNGVLGVHSSGGNNLGHGRATYMDPETQDYYDSLDLATLVGELHKTPAPQQHQPPPLPQMQTPVPFNLSLLNTTSVGPPDFPEPSPAACGKRKHAELQAAQMLAASSSSK
eukprot:gene23785-26917_t